MYELRKRTINSSIQSIELLIEVTAFLMTMQDLAIERKRYDRVDDERRDSMIEKEENFFYEFSFYLNQGDIEKSKETLKKFHDFKIADREKMLQIEALDDGAMERELQTIDRCHRNFNDQYKTLEKTVIDKTFEEALLIEAIELISSGLAIISRIERHIQNRFKLDIEDDNRREKMFKLEDYYLVAIKQLLDNNSIETAKQNFYSFKKLKLEDRREMLRLEDLDDAVKDNELLLLPEKIEIFSLKANELETKMINKKKKEKKQLETA